MGRGEGQSCQHPRLIEKEGDSSICDSMDEAGGHGAWWNLRSQRDKRCRKARTRIICKGPILRTGVAWWALDWGAGNGEWLVNQGAWVAVLQDGRCYSAYNTCSAIPCDTGRN